MDLARGEGGEQEVIIATGEPISLCHSDEGGDSGSNPNPPKSDPKQGALKGADALRLGAGDNLHLGGVAQGNTLNLVRLVERSSTSWIWPTARARSRRSSSQPVSPSVSALVEEAVGIHAVLPVLQDSVAQDVGGVIVLVVRPWVRLLRFLTR